MNEKCEHSSTIVLFNSDGMSVERCTWACGDLLISLKMPNGLTVTQSVLEMSDLLHRLTTLKTITEGMADVVQWAIDDTTFTYIEDGKKLINEFDKWSAVAGDEVKST